jgi:cytochrome c553
MPNHFSEIEVARNAVIRGDVEDVRAPARWLWRHPPDASLPERSLPLLDGMRDAARAAAEASDIPAAAHAVARLAGACGRCHAAIDIRAILPTRAAPSVGGLVGHMIAHQRAVDHLHAGLVEPSDTLWAQGAEALDVAPLERRKLPPDAGLTGEIVAAETRLHDAAAHARRAATLDARIAAYAEVLSTCADCHGLHGRIWGPGMPRD